MRIDLRKESESGKRRKGAPFRVVSPFPLVPRGTRQRTRQPEAFVREPGALLSPREAYTYPLHGKREASELGQPLTLRQVAALIGCSPWTVRQTLIPRGLPYFRSAASGRLIFYTHQIVGWIESQQFQGGN